MVRLPMVDTSNLVQNPFQWSMNSPNGVVNVWTMATIDRTTDNARQTVVAWLDPHSEPS